MAERKVMIGRLPALLRGPEWLSRDAHIVILARAVRTFGYGCTSILLAGMLSEDGVPAPGIGLLLGVAALGSVTASIAMGVFADRFGRRRSLLVTAGLMGLAGVVFAVCESYPMLLVAAFIGTISPSTNDNSPFSGVEQAILAQTCLAQHHTALFARYSMSALLAGALGGLAAAALGLLTVAEPGDAAFLLYAILSIMIFGLYHRLSPETEPAASAPNDQTPGPHHPAVCRGGADRTLATASLPSTLFVLTRFSSRLNETISIAARRFPVHASALPCVGPKKSLPHRTRTGAAQPENE